MTSPAFRLTHEAHASATALSAQELAGNVGLLVLGGDASTFDLTRLLDELDALHDTDALIIDLRQSRALAPAAASIVASWLFDTGVTLAPELYIPPGATPMLHAGHPISRYLGKRVFVVVGPDTGSVAAELARNLQWLQRAVIVGESPLSRRVSPNVHAALPMARRTAHLVALTTMQMYREGRTPTLALQAAIVGVRREMEQLRTRIAGTRLSS